jgi:hypothetical protein
MFLRISKQLLNLCIPKRMSGPLAVSFSNKNMYCTHAHKRIVEQNYLNGSVNFFTAENFNIYSFYIKLCKFFQMACVAQYYFSRKALVPQYRTAGKESSFLSKVRIYQALFMSRISKVGTRNFNLNVQLFMSSKPQGIDVGYNRKSYPLASLLPTNPASDQKTSEKNRWQLTSAHFLILMENTE